MHSYLASSDVENANLAGLRREEVGHVRGKVDGMIIFGVSYPLGAEPVGGGVVLEVYRDILFCFGNPHQI